MKTQRITSVNTETAGGSNKKNFEGLKAALGLIPNMTLAMGQSPAVLEGYVSLNGALAKGSLDRTLREKLALTLAGANHCDYCASAHSVLGKLAGLNETELSSALNGNAADARTSAALRFAQTLVEKKGRIGDADFEAVRSAGFSEGDVAEIVAHVALNTFTNYFNNVARTDVDFPKVNVSEAV